MADLPATVPRSIQSCVRLCVVEAADAYGFVPLIARVQSDQIPVETQWITFGLIMTVTPRVGL